MTDHHHEFAVSSAFIDDALSLQCQHHQHRPFLLCGAEPTVGQRVEVSMFLLRRDRDVRAACDDNEQAGVVIGNSDSNDYDYKRIRPFRLSGEVVKVCDRPCLEYPCPRPRSNSQSLHVNHHQHAAITDALSRRIINLHQRPLRITPSSSQNTANNNNNYFYPSTSSHDTGINGGSCLLTQYLQHYIDNGAVNGMERIWNDTNDEMKEGIYQHFVEEWGAVHGQQVVVEARLNFDYDARRGREEGPWSDLIPIDGRDVWRFTMVFNDEYEEDAWHAIPSSFQNMGPNYRNRCWPWTDSQLLPYARTGVDAPVYGSGPSGEILIHLDLGPFSRARRGGRRSKPYSFQAHAA